MTGVHRSRARTAGRIATAILGSAIASFAGTCFIARFLPLAAGTRLMLAVLCSIPLWVTGMCFGFLARRNRLALVVYALVSTALLALTVSIPR